MNRDISLGKSYPLGATVEPKGVNFCVFSKNATAIDLLLFDTADAPEPAQIFSLDPKQNKTFYYWHIFVSGITSGQIYAYRVHGPYMPELGLRFDGQKVLLDPYTRAIVGWHKYSREAAIHPGNNSAQALRSVVVDTQTYDWEGDQPLKTPYAASVIYELHVGGFTSHPNSQVSPEKRGTYAGLIEKIPYLKDLGITAVELLPIHQFDAQDAKPGLENYWGYSTMSFFAPHSSYSSRRDPLGSVDEFRDMVKALHRAGIEVILDVVFNHTAEGNHQGPILSLKGFENGAYYILEDNPVFYKNYSGCGNTLKANHEIVGRMILDCLRYWVAEMHVDGFRFDLASILSRSRSGEPLKDPPILWSIESDPLLAGTKIIAEAWDAAGLYQVGSFIGDRFAEWNGPFRDDVRRFVKGDPGMVPNLAARLMGSPDIYPQEHREPNRSINFVTCHDGLTLNDLVSYNFKHNQANKEDNRDGANDDHSWNCGVEGITENPEIAALRLRQIKNFLTILLVSQGTPMILMGDEIRHTQLGNNNAYCQNNELSWFDWSKLETHAELHRFVKEIIQFIQSLQIFQQERILAINYDGKRPYIAWHGVYLGMPDWGHDSHSLALTLHHPVYYEHLYIIFNAYWQPLKFELPPLDDPAEHWYQIVDTAQPAPQDICSIANAPQVRDAFYPVAPRSTVILRANFQCQIPESLES
ncbi:glycogen debranching protein [Neosynechococcus sphagnicola sy1]|uniref:Glycogen debranching protein n=1 Tax=Neosynechococcus sphagnicola sy1 TaxID=1497020 RepID=A0A098TNQ3_9CYAN|nr:glycogen debranching protein GlgX [Neosynechococcus sphagnicola]KGF73891.1 glycogen debranching protein [Neosynechococcus sphagnicola sy1]